MGRKINIPENELRRFYEEEKLTAQQIAEKYKCCKATILKKLHQFDIKLRLPGSPRVNLPKERLVEWYVVNRLSTHEIERRYGFVRSTVYRKLKKYGIIRTRAESHVIYPKRNFSGDLLEKTYLIGFTLGDLRVRKQYKNSETIKVDCASTKTEQIRLIKNLFEKYGRVWCSKPKNGKQQIEVYLNLSFSFLLQPKKELEWILQDDVYFTVFLAGFTDAEGSIYMTKKKLVIFSIGNYDRELLSLIQKKLLEIGIECRGPYEDKVRRKVFEKYIRKQSYWNIRVHKQRDLLRLFNLLDPHLKHLKRIKDMETALKILTSKLKTR